VPRQTVPIEAAATPADATDKGGSPAKKTKQDAAADSSNHGESSGAAAFLGAPRRAFLEDYNEHDATIKRPDGCCKPFYAHGTSPDRCIGVRVAPTALPSYWCLTFAPFFVRNAAAAADAVSPCRRGPSNSHGDDNNDGFLTRHSGMIKRPRKRVGCRHVNGSIRKAS